MKVNFIYYNILSFLYVRIKYDIKQFIVLTHPISPTELDFLCII